MKILQFDGVLSTGLSGKENAKALFAVGILHIKSITLLQKDNSNEIIIIDEDNTKHILVLKDKLLDETDEVSGGCAVAEESLPAVAESNENKFEVKAVVSIPDLGIMGAYDKLKELKDDIYVRFEYRDGGHSNKLVKDAKAFIVEKYLV